MKFIISIIIADERICRLLGRHQSHLHSLIFVLTFVLIFILIFVHIFVLIFILTLVLVFFLIFAHVFQCFSGRDQCCSCQPSSIASPHHLTAQINFFQRHKYFSYDQNKYVAAVYQTSPWHVFVRSNRWNTSVVGSEGLREKEPCSNEGSPKSFLSSAILIADSVMCTHCSTQTNSQNLGDWSWKAVACLAEVRRRNGTWKGLQVLSTYFLTRGKINFRLSKGGIRNARLFHWCIENHAQPSEACSYWVQIDLSKVRHN